MGRTLLVLAMVAMLAGAAHADVIQLDISSAVNYDAVATDAERAFSNLTTGADHRVRDILGDHDMQYGSTYYGDGTDSNFPANGLVGGVNGDYYQIGKGQTYIYDVPAGDTRSDQSIRLRAYSQETASSTVTLLPAQQAKYDTFNMLFAGGTQDRVAGSYEAAVQVKYVDDPAIYSVFATTCNGTLGGGFGTGSFTWDDATDADPAFQHAYVATQYAGTAGASGNRSTSIRTGARYLWEFATPLDLDETKVLESIDISVTTNSVNRANTVTVFAITAETIPEPATMSLLALGGLALARRRRR